MKTKKRFNGFVHTTQQFFTTHTTVFKLKALRRVNFVGRSRREAEEKNRVVSKSYRCFYKQKT